MSNSALPESVILHVPPLDCSSKEITPPSEPSTPPLAVMLAVAAVVLSTKVNDVAAKPAPIPPLMTKVAIGRRRAAGEVDEAAKLTARARPDRRVGAFFGRGSRLRRRCWFRSIGFRR